MIGLLFLPGVLFYFVYNVYSIHNCHVATFLFIPGLCLVAASEYAFLTLSNMDMNSIQTTLQDKKSARFAKRVFIVFDILFFARSIN